MQEFKKYIEDRLSKYDMSPSALALSYYYVGGEGKFTDLRKMAEQIRKQYYQQR